MNKPYPENFDVPLGLIIRFPSLPPYMFKCDKCKRTFNTSEMRDISTGMGIQPTFRCVACEWPKGD